jgi:NADPH:quinone reductase-like Zn-dependent oxidoreductase/NADP-dependent 3-hydroxy acid dehydrogenase YdfG
MHEPVDAAPTYARFSAVGLDYGPSFQGIRRLWRGEDEALAEVELSAADASEYGLHPALLDACMQAVAGLFGAETGGDEAALFLPFAMGRLRIHRSGASSGLVHVRRERGAADGLVSVDLTLLDEAGEVLAELEGLRLKRADVEVLRRLGADAPRGSDGLYRLDWTKVALAAPSGVAPLTGRVVIVSAAPSSAATSMAERLMASGASCEVVPSAQAISEADHVVCLWEGGDAIGLAAAGLAQVQALIGKTPAPRLWWVTSGAVAVLAADAVAVASSSLLGLGRVVMQEHPELRCTLVDIASGADLVDVLARELAGNEGETQVAWREGRRHVARLVRADAAPSVPQGENYHLGSSRKGTLDTLRLEECSRRAPGAGEVEIEVRASGVNFRDVLNALGMYPGEGVPFGGECAGVIARVGAGVEPSPGRRVGDAVMALSADAFRRFLTVDARLVARIPDGLDFEQAATTPAVFLTAWYALRDLAGLRPGERVLVHAAAGGVGMAAVQIAQWLGAEVLATASASKWDAVRALGVSRIASSRTLGFVESFREGGVDVVLNALTGELVDGGLSLLRAGGRFLEMGKTDVRDAAAIAASHPGVTYRAFDLSEAGVDRIAEMLAAIVEGFASGNLRPLPVRSFAVTEAEAAFRFMAQARHVGKLALVPPRAGLLSGDGTVLVTGGLGALGLRVADWLATRGVKHLVLTGRRGVETPGAADAVAALESRGARVTVAAVDVSDRASLGDTLAAIPPELPLRGVVHAAGVLDDGVLVEQTGERFAHVMSPKVTGAWNLHELTREAELDFFVLFSSVAATFGSAGQGPYAAGNAFLDALAAHRRSEGLPAQSLAWGPWADGGMASALGAARQARLGRQGVGTLSTAQALEQLAAVLGRAEPHVAIVPLDVRVIGKAFGGAVPPLWRALVRAASARHGAGAWARELAALSAEGRACGARPRAVALVTERRSPRQAALGARPRLADGGGDPECAEPEARQDAARDACVRLPHARGDRDVPSRGASPRGASIARVAAARRDGGRADRDHRTWVSLPRRRGRCGLVLALARGRR